MAETREPAAGQRPRLKAYLEALRDLSLDEVEEMLEQAEGHPDLWPRTHINAKLKDAAEAQRRLDLLAKA